MKDILFQLAKISLNFLIDSTLVIATKMSATKAKQGSSDCSNTALFEENVRLKQILQEIQATTSVTTIDGVHTSKFQRCCTKMRTCNIRPIIVLVLMIFLLIAFVIYFMAFNYNISSASVSALASKTRASNTGEELNAKVCNGNAKAFPDIDYALFGYNIMRGYPLAVGHDPGLTRPIFTSDYTRHKLTADRRYCLPNGLIIVPDISCVTSFTSSTIQDQYQLMKSLSISAKVAGRGWGVKFSASAEYKRKSSEVGTKEAVYINSEAKCDYYLSMIDEMQPPSLSKSFIMMARSMKTKQDVFKLFDYYGTHYLKQVTFGARFVYENRMSKHNFKSLSETSYSVTASASYAGLVRVEGSLSLSADEKKKADEFRSKVETSTISVGAPPPPNGSTNQWASEVKENPVPTKLIMAGIEDLFTEKFMQGSGINYQNLYALVNKSKSEYCEYLKKQGLIDSCKPIESYTKFHKVKLGNTQYNTIIGDERSCIDSCIQDSKCIAISQDGVDKCNMFQDGDHLLEKGDKCVLVLFIDRLNMNDGRLKLRNAVLNVQARADHESYDGEKCEEKCKEDIKCIVFSYRQTGKRCKFYQQLAITEDSIKWNVDGSYLQFSTNKTLA